MNNGRDCAHGRQVGKCDTCDLIDAEQRILELESQVEQLRDSEAYFKNGMAELQDYIDKMDPELLSLKAKVELLRVAATVVLNTRDEDGITTSGLFAKFDELSKALSFLPAQCLAEIRAQVVIDAIDAHKNKLLTFDYDTAIRVTDLIHYANRLRQQAKGGD